MITIAITNDTHIIKTSIIKTGVTSSKIDNQGYVDQYEIAEIEAGIDTRGNLQLWMQTNSDPIPMDDDDSVLASWCASIADINRSIDRSESEQVRQGANRLLEACKKLKEIYADNEEMIEQIDWYIDAADRACNWIVDPENYIGKH